MRSYNPNVSEALWHLHPEKTWTEWRERAGGDLSQHLYYTQLQGQRTNGKCALGFGDSLLGTGNGPGFVAKVTFEPVQPSALPK